MLHSSVQSYTPSTEQPNIDQPDYSFPTPTDNCAEPPPQPPSQLVLDQIALVLIDISAKAGSSVVSRLLLLLQDKDFNTALLESQLRSFADCRKRCEQISKAALLRGGFQEQQISSTTSDGSTVQTTMYLANPVDVLQRQIQELDKKGDFIFRPTEKIKSTSGELRQNQPMHTDYFHDMYKAVRQRVMSSSDRTLVWNDNDASFPESFVGFLQLFSDKTASSLTSSAFVAYPLHAVLLNCAPQQKEWLINNGYTIIGFLPVTISPPNDDDDSLDVQESLQSNITSQHSVILQDSVCNTSSSDGREQNMLLLHAALAKALQDFESVCERGFAIHSSSIGPCTCFPLLVSYCCDIPEAKNVSAVKHGLSVLRPCHRCLALVVVFHIASSMPSRHRHHTRTTRAKVQECTNLIKQSEKIGDVPTQRSQLDVIQKSLKTYSLANWESVLERLRIVDERAIPDLYSIFTFEPLHNLFLGISPKVKELLIHYLGSNTLHTNPSSSKRSQRLFSSVRASVLRGCNTVLSVFQNEYMMPGTRVDFSKKEGSSQLNGIYMTRGLRGMLEGKDYRALDVMFPFVFGYVDCWLGTSAEASLTKIHVSYTDLVNRLMTDNFGEGWSAADFSDMQKEVSAFKEDISKLFGPHCKTGLQTLKFHLLDHMVLDLERFGSLRVLSASPYEHFNLFVKQAYNSTSKRIPTRTKETVARLQTALKRQKVRQDTSTSSGNSITIHQLGLVQCGCSLSLQSLLSIHADTTNIDAEEKKFLASLRASFDKDAMVHLNTLISEQVQSLTASVLPTWIRLVFVQSGYVEGGLTPSLDHCSFDEDDNWVLRIPSSKTTLRQRVFGIGWRREDMKIKQSFVLIRSEENETECTLWVAKVLLFVRMDVNNTSVKSDYAFVQYMEVTNPVTEVDKALGCVCLRWATDDEKDWTLDIEESLKSKHIDAAEWYGLVPFSSIVSTVQVLRSNIAIKPFTPQLPWPLHRFYINRFHLPKDPLLPESDD